MAHIVNNGIIEFSCELNEEEARTISEVLVESKTGLDAQEGIFAIDVDDVYVDDFETILEKVAECLSEDNEMHGEIDFSGERNGKIFIEDGKITSVDSKHIALYKADQETLIEHLVKKGYPNPDIVIYNLIVLLAEQRGQLLNDENFLEYVCCKTGINKKLYAKLISKGGRG